MDPITKYSSIQGEGLGWCLAGGSGEGLCGGVGWRWWCGAVWSPSRQSWWVWGPLLFRGSVLGRVVGCLSRKGCSTWCVSGMHLLFTMATSCRSLEPKSVTLSAFSSLRAGP